MKRGFTLAEVLITLAIIGVVAAMTLPSLNTNVSSQKVYPALMKAMNTLEEANSMLLADSGARNLLSACGEGETYAACIMPYIKGATAATLEKGAYKDYDMSTPRAIGSRTMRRCIGRNCQEYDYVPSAFTTKDGMTYICEGHLTRSGVLSLLSDTGPDYYRNGVTIDINGASKGPNALGHDTFIFIIDYSDGSVIPYGGREYKAKMSTASISYGVNSVLWEADCKQDAVPTFGASCTGSVIDNGRVIYK